MKPHPRVIVGWRVLTKEMLPDKEGNLIEHIKPLTRVYHVKSAAMEYYTQALKTGIDCWVAEVIRPERKELAVK